MPDVELARSATEELRPRDPGGSPVARLHLSVRAPLRFPESWVPEI